MMRLLKSRGTVLPAPVLAVKAKATEEMYNCITTSLSFAFCPLLAIRNANEGAYIKVKLESQYSTGNVAGQRDSMPLLKAGGGRIGPVFLLKILLRGKLGGKYEQAPIWL